MGFEIELIAIVNFITLIIKFYKKKRDDPIIGHLPFLHQE